MRHATILSLNLSAPVLFLCMFKVLLKLEDSSEYLAACCFLVMLQFGWASVGWHRKVDRWRMWRGRGQVDSPHPELNFCGFNRVPHTLMIEPLVCVSVMYRVLKATLGCVLVVHTFRSI